jgi:dihydroorotase
MKKNSFSNYGIYGYTDNINNIKNLINHVIGFKIFMAHTTGGLVLDDSIDLPDLIRNLDLTGKITVFHAEEPKYFLKEQADNLVKYSKIRNCKSEAEAIKRVINVNAKNIHIAHLSCPDNLQYVYGKSFEVTPHHILLNNELPLNTYGKVNPPIRSEKDRLNLFNAFKEGIVPIMASDHAPHLENEKIVSFENAPAGIPGVETMYPLMLYLSKKGLLNISNVIRSLSENPAKLFNLQKGVIASNMDADLAIFDMDKVTNIKGNRLHSKAGWTPYEGFSAIFPKDVYIGGIRVIKEYELNSDPAGRSVVETKKHSNFIN